MIASIKTLDLTLMAFPGGGEQVLARLGTKLSILSTYGSAQKSTRRMIHL